LRDVRGVRVHQIDSHERTRRDVSSNADSRLLRGVFAALSLLTRFLPLSVIEIESPRDWRGGRAHACRARSRTAQPIPPSTTSHEQCRSSK
jgi:hypothetical protein